MYMYMYMYIYMHMYIHIYSVSGHGFCGAISRYIYTLHTYTCYTTYHKLFIDTCMY